MSATGHLYLPCGNLSLSNTLDCGQVFCWRREEEYWYGWIAENPVKVSIEKRSGKNYLNVESLLDEVLDKEEVQNYFGLNDDLDSILKTFPKDPWMEQATEFSAGLYLLRQPTWECLAGFITSAVKQVPHIKQINLELRKRFGTSTKAGNCFPSIFQIAQVQEKQLRDAKLGFRAKYLLKTSQQIYERHVSLEKLHHLKTAQACIELQKLSGVGAKIAHCVLLFAYTRWTAFPIDVWIARGLKTLYFPQKTKMTLSYLQEFAAEYFGPYRGLAQQYLFHWLRLKQGNDLTKKRN